MVVHRPSSSIASIGQVLALDAKIGEGEAEVRRKRKKDAAGPRLLRAGRLCHLFLHLRRGHPHTKISGLGKRRRGWPVPTCSLKYMQVLFNFILFRMVYKCYLWKRSSRGHLEISPKYKRWEMKVAL